MTIFGKLLVDRVRLCRAGVGKCHGGRVESSVVEYRVGVAGRVLGTMRIYGNLWG